MSREFAIASLITMAYLYPIINGLYGIRYVINHDELTIGKFFDIAFFGVFCLLADITVKVSDTFDKWVGGDPPAWWTDIMSREIYIRRKKNGTAKK